MRLIGCLLFVGLQLGIVKGQSLSRKLEVAFRNFESDPSLHYGIASLTVLNAQTGEVVFAKNEETGLATASTLKTITSATAFYLLGPEYRYSTKLYYTGNLSADGTLKGDIIISGSGDPSLGSDRFEQSREGVLLARWQTAIQRAGIKQIEGGIIADDCLFDGQSAPGGWTWNNLGNYYGAGVSALNWRENQFAVNFTPGSKTGDLTRIREVIPETKYLQLVNETRTGKLGSGDQVNGYGGPYASRLYLRGSYGKDLRKKICFSLPDAAYDAAYRLKQWLDSAGIHTMGEPATTHNRLLAGIDLPVQRNLLDEYKSPELADLIYWFQQKSINLYGEALLKTMAVLDSAGHDPEDEARVVRDFWVKKAGIPEAALDIIDGSGLSPQNRVTTLAMARILASVKTEPWFNSYYKSFPEYNGMKMKSGTTNGVLGYSGYQISKDGTPLVFCLLVNNYHSGTQIMRQKMFRLLDTLKL
ncbi:D-alanyl-D-alanine carboxypeptidase / D-alanyl-D-alanine-endopeptidase (penicillin-binding protein 4) [bacterium A37T11]|nr:D-alanyl-D-alanine carboxypeptidase / D-alanyl-D-alanine-endopeptidase (penicillin-binding protein 4) [bacterium A37T11]